VETNEEKALVKTAQIQRTDAIVGVACNR